MLQPWKSDSITSHGVPVTHCEQAAILVLKLKVVQLRKFSFPPNIFFLFFLSIAWISSESDFLRGVLFPRVRFAPHRVFQRICILNTMHSIDGIYQHDMHSEDSNHIFQSWQPTWKPLTLFLKDVRADVHGQLFCHVEENQLYTVWCWDVSRHSMLRYHKMKVENFIKVFKTETFLWHVPAHHYIILVNMVEKFLNTKTSWTFKKNHHLAHNVF